ncbi:MAG: PAS domain S-box protein [Methanomicrobiaceae archaeon]|nr:PAS domain S-box protein [Methanomicrobiaceae archaeon]
MDVLLVDDEPMLLDISTLFLERQGGIRVYTASSAQEGLELLEKGTLDVVVSDYQMPGMDGIEFLKELRERGSTIPFIIFTGRGREDVVIEALNSGADFYVQKGGDPTAQFTELAHKIQQAVHQHETEKSLEEERNRLEQVSENIGACLAIIDPGFHVLWTNSVTREICGDTEGEPCYRALHGRGDACPECAIRQIFDEKVDRTLFERVFTGKAGEKFYFEVITTPLRDEKGAVYAALQVAVPITEIKEAEAALRASEEEKRIILDSVSENITFQDTSLRILWANRAAAESIAMKPEELVGHACYELWHQRDMPCFGCPVERAIRTKQPQRAEMTTPDGRVWFVAGYPVLDDAGEVKGAVETTLDISERRRSQDLLRMIQYSINQAADLIFWFGKDGRFIYVNDAACSLLGYIREELLDMRIPDISPELPPSSCDEEWRGVEKSKASVIRTVLRTRGGDVVPVEIRASLVMVDDQPVVCSIARDLRDQIRAEEELRAREEMFRTIAQRSSDMIYTCYHQGGITFISPAVERILGYTPEEMIGGECGEYVLDSSSAAWQSCYDAVSRGETIEGEVIEFRRRDGSAAVLEVSESPIVQNGRVTGVQTVGRDITERLKARKALEESERRFRTLVESVEEAVMIIDRACRITYVNPYVARLLGRDRASLQDSTFEELLPAEVVERATEMAYKVFDSGKMTRFTFFYPGIDRWLDVAIVPLHREDPRVTTLCYVARDITDLKQLEQSLAQANAKLQLLSSITRHDILNQITALLAYVTLLKDEAPETPEIQRYIDLIEQLTYRIEGQISFTRDYEDMGVKQPAWQNVKQTVERVRGSIPLGPIDLSIETGTLEVFADPMLEKIFFNLISNSIQHGEKVSKIRVSVRWRDGGAVILVEDDGRGIPDGMKEEIFRKGVGKHKGYGLFLAKEILSITGISIHECGREGEGARFEIVVPAGIARTRVHNP